MVSKAMTALSLVLALGLAQPVIAQDAGGSGGASGGTSTDSGGASGGTTTDSGGASGGTTTDSGGASGSGSTSGSMQSGSGEVSGSTSTTINLTTEQQTQIVQDLSTVNAPPVEVNFDVTVGASVPGTVTLQPVPTQVIEIVPQYQGFLFFVLADGRIAIVDPNSHQIVAILSA